MLRAGARAIRLLGGSCHGSYAAPGRRRHLRRRRLPRTVAGQPVCVACGETTDVGRPYDPCDGCPLYADCGGGPADDATRVHLAATTADLLDDVRIPHAERWRRLTTVEGAALHRSRTGYTAEVVGILRPFHAVAIRSDGRPGAGLPWTRQAGDAGGWSRGTVCLRALPLARIIHGMTR